MPNFSHSLALPESLTTQGYFAAGRDGRGPAVPGTPVPVGPPGWAGASPVVRGAEATVSLVAVCFATPAPELFPITLDRK